MSTKYYIYRNLHKKCASVRLKGLVVEHPDYLMAYDVEFKVSQKGRERVLREKQKNVHAYMVCPLYLTDDRYPALDATVEIRYNPYENDSFIRMDTKEPVQFAAWVQYADNKIMTSSHALDVKPQSKEKR